LKQFAAQRHLLVMGPDCGTSLIGGVGIGFANAVRRGSVGAVGASGTGLQEFTSLVHNAGFGISQAIGTGSHDLSDKIGGLTTLAALQALENDPRTKSITLLSKPPGPRSLAAIIARMERCTKPVIGCFLGAHLEAGAAPEGLRFARTIDEAAHLAVVAAHGRQEELGDPATPDKRRQAGMESSAWAPEQKYLRGLFAGGTFCYQSQQILREAGIATHSNAPLNPGDILANPDNSIEHTLVDMGDDRYTLGRPHPMMDATLRSLRIQNESRDPKVAILLLDIILGYNAAMDPAGALLDAVRQARQAARERGGAISVVASVCGTDGDRQGLKRQVKSLQEGGVRVFPSNARATFYCCELLKERSHQNVGA
jgi:FdrA protein